MHIRSKALAVSSKIVLSLICICGIVAMFINYNEQAWRAFSTWVLILGTLYFLGSTIWLLLRKRDSGLILCPMLDGMVLSGLILVIIAKFVYPDTLDYTSELDGWLIILLNIVLPILVLLDWLIFAQKGRWRTSEPFYWLALPVTYAATMILTAEFMPETAAMRYPLSFLDYRDATLGVMTGWLLIFGLLELSASYFLVVVDSLMSGKISRRIVLPRIKTVLVEDSIEKSSKKAKR